MDKVLTLDDLDPKVKDSIYLQDYGSKGLIEGVKIVKINNFPGEDGDISEIIHLNTQGESEEFPGFKLVQVNRTLLNAGSVKAWHVHFSQDEIWYVSPHARLFCGLWDLRQSSPSCGKNMRILLGATNSQLLYLPRGVAHGAANFGSQAVEFYYFVNQCFSADHPDEQRLPWDTLSKEFWQPKRD